MICTSQVFIIELKAVIFTLQFVICTLQDFIIEVQAVIFTLQVLIKEF